MRARVWLRGIAVSRQKTLVGRYDLADLALESQGKDKSIFTGNFILACLSTLAFFGSFQLLLPTLPLYVLGLGGKESEIGLIIGVFSISSIGLRPFIGRWVDERGKKGFLLLGSVIFLLSSFLYELTKTVPQLLLLRLLHGAGIAAFTTSVNALVADIVPSQRRGEAMGYFGIFPNVATALGPALGMAVVSSYSFTVLFLVSAGLGLVALLLSSLITEPHSGQDHGEGGSSFLSRGALFPSTIVFTLTVTYGAVVSFFPLFAIKEGFTNPGLFFTVYAVVLILVRNFTGRLSDRYGRAAVIVPGLALVSSAMVLLSLTSSIIAFLLVAVLYALGFASVHPTLLALVADRVGSGQRGAAMGTFSTAFDLGIGLGAFLWGWVVEYQGFPIMFFSAGLVPLAGIVAFLAMRPKASGLESSAGRSAR